MDSAGLKGHRCLAIVGLAGSGKDTVANLVRQNLVDMECLGDLKFSASLKQAACAIFGWDISRLDDLEYKEAKDPTYPLQTRRDILKWMGTQAFREGWDEHIWLKAAHREALKIAGEVEGFIATDCRFPNEQAFITASFGETLFVRVVKGGVTESDSTHASEAIDKLPVDMTFNIAEGDWSGLKRAGRVLAEEFFHDLR